MNVNINHLSFMGRSPFASATGAGKAAGAEVRRMSGADAQRKPMVPGQERVQVREGVFADISAQGSGGNMGETVYNKMMSGEPLSDEELAWLRDNNPVEYQKALIIKMEREQYKKELENCRSKEEVSQLKERKMQQFCAEASKISGSGMNEDSKVKAMKFLEMRRAGIEYDHKEFVDSDRYKALPDKREKDEAPASREVEDAKSKALEAEIKRVNAEMKKAEEARQAAAQSKPASGAEKSDGAVEKSGIQTPSADAGAATAVPETAATAPAAVIPEAGAAVPATAPEVAAASVAPTQPAAPQASAPVMPVAPPATTPEAPALLVWA